VHVFGRRGQVIDRLIDQKFRPGLEPDRPSIGAMHGLVPMLLEAFGPTTTTDD
jgi:hypothetical protein